VFAGHALTGLSTARGSSRSGRIGLDALESAPVVKNCPGDASEFVGERNRQHIAVQAFLRRLDPRLEPVALPSFWPDLDQQDPGGLNEQRAQIAIAAPRYAAENRAVQPGLKVARPELVDAGIFCQVAPNLSAQVELYPLNPGISRQKLV
jgi:hypothetical protein